MISRPGVAQRSSYQLSEHTHSAQVLTSPLCFACKSNEISNNNSFLHKWEKYSLYQELWQCNRNITNPKLLVESSLCQHRPEQESWCTTRQNLMQSKNPKTTKLLEPQQQDNANSPPPPLTYGEYGCSVMIRLYFKFDIFSTFFSAP